MEKLEDAVKTASAELGYLSLEKQLEVITSFLSGRDVCGGAGARDYAGPSLEDILSRYGLEKKDLERRCPQGVRITIATKLVDWKTTGHYFGVPAEKLAAIDREHATEHQRRIALLDCWDKREGKSASCLKLADVLHRRERADLVELLCTEMKLSLTLGKNESASSDEKQLQSCASGIDIAKHIDTLQRQFRGLHRQFLSELNERQISVDDVLEELTLLPIECRKEYESLIQQKLPMLERSTWIATLFNRLNPLFTFIDYGLLQHLISNLGSTELKEDMTSYVDSVQEFMRVTTVGDVINHWPGDEESHASFSKLRAKFKDDPRTYTLERLNNFQRTFCCHVRLSEFIFGLKSLEPSKSFFVIWLIPTVVVAQLSKLIHQVERSFYESEHILSISVDEKQLYPPPSAAAGIASPTPALSVSARGSKQKQPKVSLAGDLITPTIAPEHAIVKKDIQPKSTDDTVDIIVIGWKGATLFAEGIIGPNKNKNLNLWDYTTRVYYPQESDDREEFMKRIKEELQARISKCQHPNLVLVLNNAHHTLPSSDPSLMYPPPITIGLSVSDLTRSLGHSIWNNAVVVQPFLCIFLTNYQHLKSEFVDPDYEWRDIDPEVVANIPVVPVNCNQQSPDLPDHIDWLSPFWDTCIQRMTESAQHAFLKANADRIKLATSGQKREDSDKPLHDQAIFYVPGPNTSKAPIRSAVSSLLETEVAGPLGTTAITTMQHDPRTDHSRRQKKDTL